MDNTNISDKCIIRIIKNNTQVEEKVIKNEEQSSKQLTKLLEGVLQKLILLNKGE